MSEADLQRRIDELERRLRESERTVQSLEAEARLRSTSAERHAGIILFEPSGGVVDVDVLPSGRNSDDDLRASELRYRRIVENTSEGVWMYDVSGTTTFMNRRMAEMLGCTVEEAIGQPIFTFMDESAQDLGRQRLTPGRRGLRERAEFKLKPRDGSVLWVSIHSDPLLDVAGNFESSLALVTEITDLRRAEETRNRLAAIVASSEDAIISRDLEGVISSWNSGAERLYGWTAAEAIGQSTAILVPPELEDEERRILERMALGQVVDHFETQRRRKEGAVVDVTLTISPIRDEVGATVGFSEIARDLTERRRADTKLRRAGERLRQAQKMEAIGVLAGGVAHDFNNLLSVILCYTELIIADLKVSDPLRVDLEEVQRASLRATELTRQLLAFSRQQVLQPVVLDLNDVVAGVEKMLARLLGAGIELSLQPSPLPGKVHADPGQIEQVLINLVVNARDAMPDGGNLSIETSNVMIDENEAVDHPGLTPGPHVLLTVTDTGTGMDGATKERIFDPFFTTKDKSKGAGLGLSTVHGIVQQSGGHISVTSELGKGTTFRVYLPRTDRALESLLPPSALSPALRGTETILLVEDEAQVRAIMRSILRKQGYHVIEAQNGGEAFLLCEQFADTIHLLLTDVVMPRMSGHQLAERLAQLRPEMKVLYISGYTDDTIAHHGVFAAGLEFLHKPIMPEALLKRARQVLDSPSRRAAGDSGPLEIGPTGAH